MVRGPPPLRPPYKISKKWPPWFHGWFGSLNNVWRASNASSKGGRAAGTAWKTHSRRATRCSSFQPSMKPRWPLFVYFIRGAGRGHGLEDAFEACHTLFKLPTIHETTVATFCLFYKGGGPRARPRRRIRGAPHAVQASKPSMKPRWPLFAYFIRGAGRGHGLEDAFEARHTLFKLPNHP